MSMSASGSMTASPSGSTTLGHPHGLFALFFAEMWERFSYYGMRALLLFYMLKGFLKYQDAQAYAVYGSYTALVYMTPFFGGLLADRLLGARRAVVLGGLLMAAGHLMMTIETAWGFYLALGLLIVGNGFFKPNISTIVGSLYPDGSGKRDAGFTIFYIGINLGAAMSPLLCGYIGETYGWHYGFGLATIGMLSGLAIFVAPTRVTQFLIMGSAALSAFGLVRFRPDNAFSIGLNLMIAAALLVAGAIAWKAIGRGGIPTEVGQAPDAGRLQGGSGLGLSREWLVYVAAIVMAPLFAMIVSGFSFLKTDHQPMVLIPESVVENLKASGSGLMSVLAIVIEEISRPAGLLLFVCGLAAFAWIALQSFRLDKVRRERMYVVMVLTFFSMLFWSFFEQAGSSINNFTDRNVRRVNVERTVSADMVGQTLRIQPTQEQLGLHNGETLFTLTMLDELRAAHGSDPTFEIDWVVAEDNVGMGLAERSDETPASTFQAVNPAFILIFGLLFAMLWSWLGARGREPSTPVKFALGILQLGLGFGLLWWGAQNADSRGMVAITWLFASYLLQTTGELCLSPVGLSMVTKLSPKVLVSTVMGTWFLATAFSQYLAAIISQFTGVSGGEGGGVPIPKETVHVYGGVFGSIAIAAIVSALICFALAPLLQRWMHEGVKVEEA
ncbi:MAG: putative dipeptide and tripeptide permease YjdL [Candidatus Eisenbacteria bacterium]